MSTKIETAIGYNERFSNTFSLEKDIFSFSSATGNMALASNFWKQIVVVPVGQNPA